jgi:hypothetical protein
LERVRERGGAGLADKLLGHASELRGEDSGTPYAPDAERSFTCATALGAEDSLFPAGPPPVPLELPLVQQAQLADLIAYLHDRLRLILEAAQDAKCKEKASKPKTLDWTVWQQLIQLEMQLAVYLRQVAEPDH